VNDIDECFERLNGLLSELNKIPEFLQKFINKKVIKEWDSLTSFLIDPNIPKTNNHL
jgi:hypothetical protein